VNKKHMAGIYSVIATVMMTAGMVGVSSTSATAVPANCDWGVGHDDDEGWAECWGGTGEFRAKIKCDATWPTSNYWHYGPWVKVKPQASRSYAICGNDDWVMETGVQKR
jgi:hypothetical protein